MKFRRQSRDLEPMNLISLIDVMFFLLIFFMLSSTFTKESHLGVELPEANGTPSTETQQQIEIVINEQGTFSVNGRSLVNNEIDTLKSAILKVSEGKTDLPLLLTADAKTPHQYVVTAMDVAGQLGFVKISITSRQPETVEKKKK
ncbi:MAG: biopolymer transporter ExbD [Gammaproteobacteria bacterium]|nr:MAG: biopolymer transporter ExbD [Gammaproteobacteria bacterium]